MTNPGKVDVQTLPALHFHAAWRRIPMLPDKGSDCDNSDVYRIQVSGGILLPGIWFCLQGDKNLSPTVQAASAVDLIVQAGDQIPAG